ncbi:hypothetical protein [Chloroflexus sp.]|uniref:hypothetical protein n=1 Tax=Chloroflexus sp. TaxID=1904827 RepID=UPI002ACEE3B5|nr:hypothetical protein [Chloroflexus sp.]
MNNLTLVVYRLGMSRRLWRLLPLLIISIMALTGCAEASSQIQEVGTQTMDGVRTFSMFAAIAIAIYWLTYVVFFGLRNAWPEGFNAISNTWKAAAFITVATVIGIPALLSWAGGVVEAGGFGE